MLTVFTPTHDVKYLARLNASLAAQAMPQFEWLIVPNGPVSLDDVRAAATIPQARIVPYAGAAGNIGALKRFACEQARGSAFVEVDHDDELTPDCLTYVHAAFVAGADFVYSNCCEIRANGSPKVFDGKFGWVYRPFTWRGTQQWEVVAFDTCPAAWSKIWFAPNHLRAWRRDFYFKIGGHNPALEVLDDHDLLCRTYINSDRIAHVDRCLYVYHVHPGNTFSGERFAAIQAGTVAIHDRYIYPMVEKWCDRKGLRKIDLCGGHGKPDGYESVDLAGADITADLNERWPFADGEVGLFRAHDALEHLPDRLKTMREVYRCLAPNGWLLSQTPSTDGRGADQDPTHVSRWNSNSFWYYTRAQQAKYIGTPVRFQASRIKNFFPSPWHQTHNIVYVKADLLKFSGRTPGAVEI